MATIPLIQLVVTVAVGVAFPTLIALVGIMVNNGRFNTQRCKDGRLLHIESSLGDVRERLAKMEERLAMNFRPP